MEEISPKIKVTAIKNIVLNIKMIYHITSCVSSDTNAHHYQKH